MKVIILFGPQAVGKMSIGEKLSEKLDFPLMHNHVTLDVIWPFIGWNDTTFDLSSQLRLGIFEYMSEHDNKKGLIFTCVWAFDEEEDWNFINQVKDTFTKNKHELYWVELEADLEERLRRNKSENRLLKKPSKRDIEYSDYELLTAANKNRLNSNPGEINEKNYMRLDITNMSIDESSQEILNWINEID